MPNWSRLVLVDIEAQAIPWKAQLYAFKGRVGGTIGSVLAVEKLGAAFKSGDRSNFERALGDRGHVFVYKHFPSIGVIAKSIYRADGAEVSSTYLVSTSAKLRAIGFP
ncbi:MAG: hypothetical protein H0W86_08960 [Armatimonadetes bacterium]|nr:hypothetical protein [Armatimonadota bacterium]